jgi:hypothetical protein
MRDPNVLYSALSSFARVLYREQSMINRGSVDSMALQRYKSQIVQCLNHNDPSIRRRALDVISALIDEQNVEALIPEILEYVRLADAEFRSELIAKIYSASQRFAPSPEWNFDTVHKILVDSGNYVSGDILSSFCELIAKSGDLQNHAVARLAKSIVEYGDNQSIVQVSAFVLGEFAREEADIVDNLRRLIVLPQTSTETQLYIIMALAKLAARFGKREDAVAFFETMETSNHVEVQQRSGEMKRLLASPQLSGAVLAPIVAASAMSEEKSVIIPKKAGNEEEDVDDLVLLVMDDQPPPQPQPQPQPQIQQRPQSQPQSQVQPQSVPSLIEAVAPAQSQLPTPPGAKEMARTSDFVVFGQVQGNPKNPKQLALRLLFYNTSASRYTDFVAEYQIQPGWQMTAQKMDGNVLDVGGKSALTQVLFLTNQTNAQFSLQVRASYRFGSQPLSQICTIAALG